MGRDTLISESSIEGIQKKIDELVEKGGYEDIPLILPAQYSAVRIPYRGFSIRIRLNNDITRYETAYREK